MRHHLKFKKILKTKTTSSRHLEEKMKTCNLLGRTQRAQLISFPTSPDTQMPLKVDSLVKQNYNHILLET